MKDLKDFLYRVASSCTGRALFEGLKWLLNRASE